MAKGIGPLLLIAGAAALFLSAKKKVSPAGDCLEGLFSEEAIPLRQDILGELSPDARAIASEHTYNITHDGQAEVFMTMTRVISEGHLIPLLRTLKESAPECDWDSSNPNERMKTFENSVADLYLAVKKDMEG